MADVPSSTAPEAVDNPTSATSTKEETEKSSVTDALATAETSVAAEVKSSNTEQANPAQSESTTTPTQDGGKQSAADSSTSAAAVATTAPETVDDSSLNGTATPGTAKKSNGNTSTKKKSVGVPEHKSKKLNKKKSKAEFHLDCQPGDLYLARMKGHAPWPAIICDEELLPEFLLKIRPVTAALPDGTFKREDYAPGGKRQGERTYPVMFLYTNEFAWLPNQDLTPITPEACKDVDEKGKAKQLIAAYGVAAEGHDLEYFKTMIAEHQAAVQEDLDRIAEKEAEKEAAKAAKAEKKTRRKSVPATKGDDDNEDMEVDEEGEPQSAKSKKRKKAVDAEDESEEKPAKTPKLKLNGPKTPSTDKKTPAKPKSSTKKVVAKKDSDEEMEDAPAAEATPLSPAEIKEKKEKEIRYYRHKLQRGLLTPGHVPSDEEVSSASGWLGKLETYPGLEGDIIRSTKIHKVLRAMIRLQSIPKDETYELKKRSNELLQKWNSILGSDGDAEGTNEANVKNASEPPANAEEDKKSQAAKKQPEPAVELPVQVKPEQKEANKNVTEHEKKPNGTTEEPVKESKDITAKAAQPVPEQAKTASSETTNGVQKPSQPAAPSTAESEAPRSEEEAAEIIQKSIEASS